MVGFPIGTPVQSLVTFTSDPSQTQNRDGYPATVTSGRHGDSLVSEVHGKYGAAAQRGNVFYMSTVIAGVALPVNATNLVSKFTLYNPVGSIKVVELIEFTMGVDSATEVVNGIAIGWLSAVSVTGVPTSLTATVNGPASTLLGSGLSASCRGYTAATLVNAAVLPVYPLGLNADATAVGRSGNYSYNFDGKFWLPPDSLVTFCTTVAAATAMPLGLTWAEWLP